MPPGGPAVRPLAGMAPSPYDLETPMASFSPSSLDAFERCPKQYEFRYVLKTRSPEPKKESIEVFLGSRVHESLEELYRVREAGRVLSLAELVALFRQQWNRAWGPSVVLSKPDLSAEDVLRTGEEMLRRFYERQAPFDRDRTLGLELSVAFPLDAAGEIRIRGFIDRLAIAADGAYEVQDYKTASRLPTRESLTADRQLSLYQLGVQARFPDALPGRVKLVWYFLAHDKRLESSRTSGQLLDLTSRTLSLARSILATIDFPTRTGRHCAFCDYRALCPAWNATPPQPATVSV